MELYKREKYLSRIRGFYDADDIIKVITGVRRCGKSSLMQTVMEEIRSKGVREENILFFDLDQRAYRNIQTADKLERLIEEHATAEGMKYLFIDEIQNVSGFETVLNGFRSEGGFSIFITGSNSYLLSGELITKLTGRYLEFEMFPLTFDEYVRMKAFYGKPVSPDRQTELTNYILEGGFPRTVLFDSLTDKRTYVRGVIEEIFEKDIRRRVKIRNKEAFEAVRNYIINNFGATTSIKRLHENLRNSGLPISRATLVNYVQILVDAKIIYPCDRFDMKSKRALGSEKKYYLADLSFYYAVNTDNRINYGPVLENIVYLYCRSMNYSVSVGRIGKLECDFILRSPAMDYAYLQVAYTILSDRSTEDREYRALEAIRDNYPKYVLTTDTLLQKRNGIVHANLTDHLTGQQPF